MLITYLQHISVRILKYLFFYREHVDEDAYKNKPHGHCASH